MLLTPDVGSTSTEHRGHEHVSASTWRRRDVNDSRQCELSMSEARHDSAGLSRGVYACLCVCVCVCVLQSTRHRHMSAHKSFVMWRESPLQTRLVDPSQWRTAPAHREHSSAPNEWRMHLLGARRKATPRGRNSHYDLLRDSWQTALFFLIFFRLSSSSSSCSEIGSVCVCARTRAHVYICVCVYICACVVMCVCTHVCMYMYVHVCVHLRLLFKIYNIFFKFFGVNGFTVQRLWMALLVRALK